MPLPAAPRRARSPAEGYRYVAEIAARRFREITMFLLRPILSWPLTPMGMIWIFLPAAKNACRSSSMDFLISMLFWGSFFGARLNLASCRHSHSYTAHCAATLMALGGLKLAGAFFRHRYLS